MRLAAAAEGDREHGDDRRHRRHAPGDDRLGAAGDPRLCRRRRLGRLPGRWVAGAELDDRLEVGDHGLDASVRAGRRPAFDEGLQIGSHGIDLPLERKLPLRSLELLERILLRGEVVPRLLDLLRELLAGLRLLAEPSLQERLLQTPLLVRTARTPSAGPCRPRAAARRRRSLARAGVSAPRDRRPVAPRPGGSGRGRCRPAPAAGLRRRQAPAQPALLPWWGHRGHRPRRDRSRRRAGGRGRPTRSAAAQAPAARTPAARCRAASGSPRQAG